MNKLVFVFFFFFFFFFVVVVVVVFTVKISDSSYIVEETRELGENGIELELSENLTIAPLSCLSKARSYK